MSLEGFRSFQLFGGTFLCFVKNLVFVFSQILPLLESTALRGRFCRSAFTTRNLVLSRQKYNLVTGILTPSYESIFIIIFYCVRVNKIYLVKYALLWHSVSKNRRCGPFTRVPADGNVPVVRIKGKEQFQKKLYLKVFVLVLATVLLLWAVFFLMNIVPV